jgi:Raf kinase inhibitor-like YbhB/YbcL family protein
MPLRAPVLAIAATLLGLTALPGAADAGGPALFVHVAPVSAAGFLPLSAAFCMPPAYGAHAQDENPGVSWSAGPKGTQSYVLMMSDPDVPRQLALINKPGVTIPADAPRFRIYHWILVDIPAGVTRIKPGEDSDGLVPHGKPASPSPVGRRGANDYSYAFANDPAMKGVYEGYDGPCPPLNDGRIHDYTFLVVALDVAQLPLTAPFFAPAVLTALRGHAIAYGETHARFAFGMSD